MKLLLTSSGITNPSLRQALRRLLGKPFSKSHLTFVSTAANTASRDKTWLVNDLNNFRQLGFASFDLIDFTAVPKQVWLKSLREADVIVFGGGDVRYLHSGMKKAGLDRMLPVLLKHRVYVGISAGSMVTAKSNSLSSTDILYYERTGRFRTSAGLGLVDFEIRPHLNSPHFPKVRLPYLTKLANKHRGVFYALDDASAVQVLHGRASVVSGGSWKKFN